MLCFPAGPPSFIYIKQVLIKKQRMYNSYNNDLQTYSGYNN